MKKFIVLLLISQTLIAEDPVRSKAATIIQDQAGPVWKTPVLTIDLKSDAEWKASPQVSFDPQGRLLVLYRDKKKTSPQGNWHLVRITNPLGSLHTRQELVFAPAEEPADPDRSRTWDSTHVRLYASDDGNQVYAVFEGATVTRKPGPHAVNGLRNVESRYFTNAVSLDMKSLKVSAKRDLTSELSYAVAAAVDLHGNLLVLQFDKSSFQVTTLSSALARQAPAVTMPRAGELMQSCFLQRDTTIQCLRKNEVVHITPEGQHLFAHLDPGWIMDGQLLASQAGWIVAAYRLDEDQVIAEERLWQIDGKGELVLSSDILTPKCREGWNGSTVSSDGMSLLAACYETTGFLDYFYRLTRADLQLFNASTLKFQGALKLPSRQQNDYAVWHEKGQTVVAVLQNGVKLKLYRIEDQH